MENSNLIKILKSLNKNEFREFGKFIRSPFFNNRSEVVRFYDAIRVYYPDFNHKEFIPEYIFSRVYEKKKYSDSLMRKLSSLLSNYTLDYIAVKKFKSNSLDYNTKLLEELSKKKLDSMFEKKARQTYIALESSKHNLPYYYYKMRYSNIQNAYYLNRDVDFTAQNLQKEADNFSEYFIAEALEIFARLSNFSKVFNNKYELSLYPEVLNQLKDKNYEKVTLISLYHNILLLLNTNDEKYFFELKKVHKKFENKLGRLDEYNLFTVLFNYCISRIQAGNLKFRYERFEIDKKFVEKNLIQLDEYVELYSFLNAVTNAAYISEFMWAEKFVNDYNDKLNPVYFKDARDLSFAIIEFYRGNYRKALEYSSKIDLEFSHLKIDIKNLMVRVYYELGYFIELESLIDTYKHFLKRDKGLTEDAKRLNGDFIKFTSKLVNLKLNNKNEDVYLLKQEVENNSYFRFKEWILIKINELQI